MTTEVKDDVPYGSSPERADHSSSTDVGRSFAPEVKGEAGQETSIAALRDVIDELPEQIALVDDAWTIVAANRAWSESAAANCFPGLAEGGNYLEACEDRAAQGDQDAAMVCAGVRDIASGRRRKFTHFSAKKGKTRDREYKLNITSFQSGGIRLATVTRYDVTELMKLAQRNRRLEESLLAIQEEERRRIGRELHDATSQLLVALHLCNLRLKRAHGDNVSKSIFDEIDETLDRINAEIRAISYVLHAPPLEETSLVEAIDALARGFARRTGLDISFWFDGHSEPWDMVVQATLYRLIQEAVTNVHRHAQARRAWIRLVARPGRFLHVIVEDDGVGIPETAIRSSAPLGVGLASMRARIDELGGRFSIHRLSTGTCLIASVPLAGDAEPNDRHEHADSGIDI